MWGNELRHNFLPRAFENLPGPSQKGQHYSRAKFNTENANISLPIAIKSPKYKFTGLAQDYRAFLTLLASNISLPPLIFAFFRCSLAKKSRRNSLGILQAYLGV